MPRKSAGKSRLERWGSLTFNSGQRSGKVFQGLDGEEEYRKGKKELINKSLKLGHK